MDRLYTWKGRFFGFRDGDDLWTYTGRNVGRFYSDEVYGTDGRYLGELRSGKLIRRRSKGHRRTGRFRPRMNRMPRMKYMDHMGSMMPVGYEDFPSVEAF